MSAVGQGYNVGWFEGSFFSICFLKLSLFAVLLIYVT